MIHMVDKREKTIRVFVHPFILLCAYGCIDELRTSHLSVVHFDIQLFLENG